MQEVLHTNVNTSNLVSITEANQNFSRVARMVDENGAVVILKNNTPRYLLIEFSSAEDEQTARDEDVLAVSKRLLAKNREAYGVLAK
ncbi:MAG: type II toxin-antitoxin system Phd/YefM family antitoxin [Clostridiales bacterium]|nr:type II toxin-antitoxin system Phd/YefM family antitoxin [Clostridiales bacterium]